MYDYNANMLVSILFDHGVRRHVLVPTLHGIHLTSWIFAKRD